MILNSYPTILHHLEDLLFSLKQLLIGHHLQSLELLRVFVEKFIQFEIICLADQLDFADAHVIKWMEFILSQEMLEVLFLLLDELLHLGKIRPKFK